MSEGSVLVTGSSRGLGKALVEQFLASGWMVYGCSRRHSTIDHQNYHHYEVDIGDEQGVVSMLRAISALKVPLSLVVNNASVAQSSLAVLTGKQTALEIIQTNLLGTFFVSREALKLMQRQRYGRIINFSSINVPLGSVGSSLYNASKAGIEAMAKGFARECGSADITINTLGLSLVANSGMLDSLSAKALVAKQDALLKPDLIDSQEIFHAISFLSSPLSRNISCQTIYFGGV